jgi:hypothetical protein
LWAAHLGQAGQRASYGELLKGRPGSAQLALQALRLAIRMYDHTSSTSNRNVDYAKHDGLLKIGPAESSCS